VTSSADEVRAWERAVEDAAHATDPRRDGTAPELPQRIKTGGSFALDEPKDAPAIWGDGDGGVVWSPGEEFVIAGPIGVAKTTLSQRLVLHRLGLRTDRLLGMPVEPTDGNVLYIAADRPRQAARSLRRMVTEADRAELDERLIVWEGPPPFDLGKADPGALLGWIESFPKSIENVFIDALKDCAAGLSKDEVGAAVNANLATVLASGIELVSNHHQRKSSAENRKPTKLDDVYGSIWIPAGAGSVVLLWGSAGDPFVEFSHLKPPAGEVGPFTIEVDHRRGEVGVLEGVDLYDLARVALGDGLTPRAAAAQLYGTDEPTRNEIEKVRGKLERMRAKGKLDRTDLPTGPHYRVKSL
jgi:replicative DNA helicase